jgi:hypothetical protein
MKGIWLLGAVVVGVALLAAVYVRTQGEKAVPSSALVEIKVEAAACPCVHWAGDRELAYRIRHRWWDFTKRPGFVVVCTRADGALVGRAVVAGPVPFAVGQRRCSNGLPSQDESVRLLDSPLRTQ